ncbi:ATP-binding cassette domain-containing protein [Thioclava sp. FR2]|uniref:ATP-binding cassette domain-containing protein n=1 Tax=Thioclava sp. FR2 TaxID=3445780 RepID=UPI003EC0E9D1
MNRMLTLEKLQVSNSNGLLVDLNVMINPGETLSIMGPSGSGKSTALYALLGALPAGFKASGRVLLNVQDVSRLPPHRRKIGLLFQDDVLFPHLSVGGNLAFAIPPRLEGRELRSAAVSAALAQAGLEGFEDRDPATLSGGQRARVALMRALLAEPAALLLDEPFSRLDREMRNQIRGFVFETIRTRNIPSILVTHDHEDAIAAGGKIISPLGETLSP